MIAQAFEPSGIIRTQELIDIMQAYLKGETLEVRHLKDSTDFDGHPWSEVEDPSWNFGSYQYRIKPKFDIQNTGAYNIASNIIDNLTKQNAAIIIAQYALDCINYSKMGEEARQIIEKSRDRGDSI